MLVFDHVGKTYPNGVRALDGVSLEVAPGEILVIIGGSGCGKSTLLRAASGLDVATQGGVVLESEIPDGLPEVHGDQHLLEHALVNLLLNACDACERGGRVDIRAGIFAGQLRIEVDDDGVGISPTDAARATEPFFTTKAGNGTGLGLAIANEIVKSHRGTLVITPRTPHGTRASIQLPLPTEQT